MQILLIHMYNRIRSIKNVTKMGFMLFLVMFLCFSDQAFAAEEELSGTIQVMMHEGENVMKPYNEAFMRKFPNVTVEYCCLDDYENTISKMIAEEEFGDVVFLPPYLDVETLQKNFEPIGNYDSLCEKYNYVDRGGRIGDFVYSLPSSAYLAGIVYNKDLFYKAGISEAPKSIEEFYEDMYLIKNVTGAIPFCSLYSTDWALFSWVYFPYIEMTGNPDFRQGEFLHKQNPFSESGTHYQTFKLLADLIADGLTEQPLGSIEWGQSLEMIKNGELGCVVIGSWAIHQLIDMGMDPDSVGFMPFPNEIDGQQYMTVLTDFCIGVNRNSSNKEAALAYVEFLLDESGYAIQQDRLSVLKADVFPESYEELEGVKCLAQGEYEGDDYLYYLKLLEGINPEKTENVKRIMEAAAGISGETFDEIMNEWNIRWENARPEDMNDETDSWNQDAQKELQLNSSQFAQVEFSTIEKKYMEEHPVIKIGYLKEMAPFQFTDENGQFQGISADLLNMILEKTGMTAECYPYDNTQELIYALNGGNIDIAAGIENTKVNNGRVKFSKDYITYSNVIVNLNSIDKNQIKTDRQAVVKGEINLTDYVKADEYLEASDIFSAIQMIEKKEADFAITNCYTAEYYVAKTNNAKLKTIPISGERKLCFAFALKCEYPLISICNKCIYDSQDSVLQMKMLRYLDTNGQDITLSRVIQEYPLQSVAFLILLFLFIGTSMGLFYKEKRKHMEKHAIEMKRYEILSRLMDEYIFDFDVTDGTIHLDRKFDDLCGFSGNQAVAEYEYNNILLNIILEQCAKVDKDTFVSAPFRFTNLQDQTQWYRMTIFRIEEKGVMHQLHLIGKIINVQQEIETKLVIQDKADRDVLTGLYNRSGFEKQFQMMFSEERYLRGLTFAVLDIDNFKGVNDILGHDGGDEALKQLTNELKMLKRQNIIIGRFGGDEFMICAFEINIDDAEFLLKRLVKCMDRNIQYQTEQKHISISLGAVYTKEKIDYSQLFTAADKVLYSVKANGKNGYRIRYYEEMEEV